ncbi:MAG: outer membrane beta-barrel protein [Bacteroidia bacterium]|nr:PorT family protein [Bacteroidia bacterium]MDW8332986.1 outer membrane beta-barrel protein [Bacteroidia bacterium]
MKRAQILAVLIALSHGAAAQVGWHLGMRVVPSKTWVLNGADSDIQSRWPDSLSRVGTYGVQFGLAYGYGFNAKFAAMGNILYSTQGQHHTYAYRKLDADGEYRKVTVVNELRLRYLKFPFLFRYTTNPDRKVAFAAEIGPQLSLLLSELERTSDKRYRFEQMPNFYITNFPDRIETLRRVDFGAVVAAGVDVKLRFNIKMNVQLRWDVGLVDVENKNATFNLTRDGITEEIKYYNFRPPNDPNYTLHRDYSSRRGASRNMTLGLGIGFAYIFIPNFHY